MPPSVFQPPNTPPPRPAKKNKTLTSPHGDTRPDEYYWLNERENPEVIAYLEAENRYAEAVLEPVKALRETLYQELKARIREDDQSVPYFKNGYWYISRFETGKEYPVFLRKKGSLDAQEELLIDVNVLAEGHEYCQLGGFSVSPDNRLIAYGVDYSGRNLFRLYFKDLESQHTLPDAFDYGGAVAWALDSRTVLYDTKDSLTLRNDKVWRHTLGTAPSEDVLMYHEQDESQYVFLQQSKSEQYFFIHCAYTQTMEALYLHAGNPQGEFRSIRPRENDFYYEIEHWKDRFLIRTNWNAPNFRLMSAPIQNPVREHWKDLLPPREGVLIEGFTVFNDYLVSSERRGGLSQLYILHLSDGSGHYIEIGEPTYSCGIDHNPEFDTPLFRYHFSSLKTPHTVVDYHLKERRSELRKVAPVLGGFDAAQYETELVWVNTRDGVRVPMSLCWKKGLRKDGSAPCHLTGYGAYGFCYEPGFNRDKLSLLDRGFLIGIAHVRGGMEMGFEWYENGKMGQKINTFQDFIDCAQYLVQEKYTSPDRLFAEGRSAGGLLMGAVVNMRPDLFKGIISGVPFVDVLSTMSDPDIPLTTSEYGEWGNPAIPAEYAYMKQYSPYDNLRAGAYPNMLVLTSFADSQVQYFEPAKYVARLRDLKTDDNMLLFITSMSGSHGGASGRFKRLEDRALEYGFMLFCLEAL